MGNLVAIVGRPNVGKSTLFNRLTKTRQAIVNEEAGTTRDRQYGKTEWLGREFSVVDTGGWVVNSDDIFEEEIRKQVLMAVDEADVILFVVDVMNGVTDLDEQVAAILRRAKKPVLLVANKTDNHELQYNAPEFYSLGLGDPYCISAVTGSGTGDMMDLIVGKFKKESDEILDEDIPRFAVVGRPNAGKSSIVNAFIGEDRNIVTEIAGTTRDSIYTRYNKFGFDFYLVDTAGIRKKNKVNEDLEYYSVIRSIRSIENADVCILMVDATRGIESQDLNIFSLIQKNAKGLVVVVNKWDLVQDKTVKVMKTFEDAIRNRFAPFVDFPIIFASALTKQRILKVLEEARDVYENRMTRIPTARLNEEMLPLIEAYPPPSIKGKYIKIKYITQLPNTQVPSFVYFANLPQYVKEPYRRFLERTMLTNYASSFLFEGKTDSALVYTIRASERSAADKDTAMLIENLNQLGTIYRRKKDLENCIANFEQALHLCELRGNHNAVAFIYGNIATAYCDWNRPGDAIPFSEKAVEYALKTGNKRRIGTCYVNLGAIQTRLVQMRAEGIATLLKAIPILEEVNDRRLLCDAYNYLVNAYRMDGNLNQAMYYLQKLDKLAHEMQTDAERFRYYQAKAGLLQESKKVYRSHYLLSENNRYASQWLQGRP